MTIESKAPARVKAALKSPWKADIYVKGWDGYLVSKLTTSGTYSATKIGKLAPEIETSRLSLRIGDYILNCRVPNVTNRDDHRFRCRDVP